MKSKLVVAVLMLALPVMANADRYGHRVHHGHGGGGAWIAPAIIGGAIVGSAIYGATRDAPPPPPYYYQPSPQEIREEQLRQREYELERREHEYYDRQARHRDYDNDNCREYYRNDGRTNYYSRNCW